MLIRLSHCTLFAVLWMGIPRGVPAQQAAPAPGATKAAPAVPRGTRQSPLRKLRESGEPQASTQPAAVSSKIERYAKKLVKKYDADGDDRLNSAEVANLQESVRVSDFDRDGFITADELVRRMVAYSRRRSIRIAPLTAPGPGANSLPVASLPGDPNGSASKLAEETPEPAAHKRFVVSPNRNLGSLPNWFTSSDVDGDGQVTLAEMSAATSPESVARFNEIDRSGDGVITPTEALEAQKNPAQAPSETAPAEQVTPAPRVTANAGR